MSRSSVQVCLLSSVSTAMQERRAEFVLAPAVKVQWGGEEGAGRTLFVVWLNMKELML